MRSAPDATRRILSWYRRNGRPLPWRRTRRPYRILLSEVMLQQTPVARVTWKYREFLRRFPTLTALAHAPRRDVVIAWRGLGYNNRAVRLHALARQLHRFRRSRFPRSVPELMQLPGVGRYTAHAVAAFAFGQPVPVVDVNVRRVLSRLFLQMGSTTEHAAEASAWRLAAGVLPHAGAYEWNQALMDLGAMVCTAAQPRCGVCPVADLCRSRSLMLPARRSPATQREPSHRGVPLRLYRGRIIEALRDAHPRRSVSAPRVGKAILPRFTERDRQVFRRILLALERDGLVQVTRGHNTAPKRIALA